jgi:transposase InsO family protein
VGDCNCGSVGDSYDCEFTVLPGEPDPSLRWPWRSLEAVKFATLEWVDWFNNRRLLERIGNRPLAEAEAEFYAADQDLPMVA